MDIRLINRETAESLISKAYRETKKFLKILHFIFIYKKGEKKKENETIKK